MLSTAQKSQRLTLVLQQLPRGHITSYGQLARLAGLGRQARWVGRWMGQQPASAGLPWYRVLRSGGQLPFPLSSPAGQAFAQPLQEEGVIVQGSGVNWQRFAWLKDHQEEEAWLLWARHALGIDWN
ncbi:MGMT family protein [Balneatrix alpica]|uniref:MGMT family protein n=1 Tax=Balneatrix alpica TaxID=75684 RepID=A0ABV5ZAA1_9GAMM|nr:MGMT family protein [Balneatrix alpica]